MREFLLGAISLAASITVAVFIVAWEIGRDWMRRDRETSWREQVNAGDIAGIIVAGTLWLGVLIGIAALGMFIWVAGTKFAFSEEQKILQMGGLICNNPEQVVEIAQASDPHRQLDKTNQRDGRASCVIARQVWIIVLEDIQPVNTPQFRATVIKVEVQAWLDKDDRAQMVTPDSPVRIQYMLRETNEQAI